MEFDDDNNNNNNNNNPIPLVPVGAGGDNQSVASAGIRDRVAILEGGILELKDMMQVLLQRLPPPQNDPPPPRDPAPFPPAYVGDPPPEDPAVLQAREARRGAVLERPQLGEEAKVDLPVDLPVKPPGLAQIREQQQLAAERLEAHMAAQQRLAAEQRQEQADALRRIEDQRIEERAPLQQLLAQGVQGRVPPAPDPDSPANDYGQNHGRDWNHINSQGQAVAQCPEHPLTPALVAAPDSGVRQLETNTSATQGVGVLKGVLVYILGIAGHLSLGFYHASPALFGAAKYTTFGCVSPLQTPQVRPLPWPPPRGPCTRYTGVTVGWVRISDRHAELFFVS